MDQMDRTDWKLVAERKRRDREEQLAKHPDWRVSVDKSIADTSQLYRSKLSEKEQIIVMKDATALVQAMASRQYKAIEVLAAFVKAAWVAQDATNCLTEIFVDEAFKRATELDEYIEKEGKVFGPLHGLPISIKDHIKVKGRDTSTGYVAWAYETVSDSDAVVVRLLKEAGAILYVKTQNPQTLLSLETNNNIFGRTVNPFNRELSPGGSSGGESALIASHGSPIGIGTDIGGSIRIPAAHCGLYGLKGSVARLPHAGLLGSHDGMDAIIGCVGPLATSARDLELFCRVLLNAEPWFLEAPLIEMPWKAEVAKGVGLPEKLSIAILYDDGVVQPHPPISKALAQYKEYLIAAGHDVIEWKPLDHQAGWDLIVKLYLLDGGVEYWETLKRSGEPAVQQTRWILEQGSGHPFQIDEVFRLNLDREAFRAQALAHWNDTKLQTTTGRPVDAILCPVAPTLAPTHDTTCYWPYSSHWNLLDLPAVVFPVGKMTGQEVFDPMPRPRNETEARVQGFWNPEMYKNMPISLQLVARRFNEERLLAMLDVVEQAQKDYGGMSDKEHMM